MVNEINIKCPRCGKTLIEYICKNPPQLSDSPLTSGSFTTTCPASCVCPQISGTCVPDSSNFRDTRVTAPDKTFKCPDEKCGCLYIEWHKD